MGRFCGTMAWRAARIQRANNWPHIAPLLSMGATDYSPSDGQSHLAVWLPGGGPVTARVFAQGPAATVVFSGYLLDLPPGCAGEAQYVLDRYSSKDWSWLRHANGVFAFAVLDRHRDRCVLGVDRFGIRPLFFATDESGLAFGSDFGVVAASLAPPREIDYDALQEMIAIGFPLGDGTMLRGVKRAPPGSWIEFVPGACHVTRYWSVEHLPPTRVQDAAAFIDESSARLRRAIVRLAERNGDTALCFLSSGWDSRRILLEGHAAGVRFETITAVWPYYYREDTTIDPAVVGELCRRLGFVNRLVRLPEAMERAALERDRKLRDTLLDFQVEGRDHIWAVPLLAVLPATGSISFDGLLGDILLDHPFYSLPEALWGRWKLDDEILNAIAPHHRNLDREWDRLVTCSLSKRVGDAWNALPDGPARLSFFHYFLGRSRRVIALLPYGLFDLRVEPVCPYLDVDVIDHAWTFDPVRKAQLGMQRMALDRLFPDFAALPSSHSALEEVPPQYFLHIDFADPNASRRFTLAELARLFKTRLGLGIPKILHRDLAFTALNAVGLGGLAGGWREAHIRGVIHAQIAAKWLGSADTTALLEARRKALDWLGCRDTVASARRPSWLSPEEEGRA